MFWISGVHFTFIVFKLYILFEKSLKLLFTIFYQIFIFSPNDSPSKTMKNVFFISSKKLFSFSRYSNFCNSPLSTHFSDSKGQMEVE